MNKQPLSEKEFEIINIVADGFRASQRDLSLHVGLSLGMTNLLLRRLVTKGYLRAKQLTSKKVEYLLTPRGIAEKTKKTYHYALKTIQSFGLIKRKLRQFFSNVVSSRVRRIIIVGTGDLVDFMCLVLRDMGNPDLIWDVVEEIPKHVSDDAVVIITDMEFPVCEIPQGRCFLAADIFKENGGGAELKNEKVLSK